MTHHRDYPEAASAGGDVRLAWLIAIIANGLVIVAAALALDLHNQKRRLETMSAQLSQNEAARDAEIKSLAASNATAQIPRSLACATYSDREAELKRLDETFAQHEPLAKQSTEVQAKLEALASDLLNLAKIDPDAREIVRKYNIGVGAPASAPAAPK